MALIVDLFSFPPEHPFLLDPETPPENICSDAFNTIVALAVLMRNLTMAIASTKRQNQ